MKNSFLKNSSKVLSPILAIMLIAIPLLAQDQQQIDAFRDGSIAAESIVNGTTWFAVGCLLGIVGWLAAMLIEPNPPAAFILGKSPEYVTAFSAGFKETGKAKQQKNAMYGCLTSTVLTVGIYAIAIAAANSY